MATELDLAIQKALERLHGVSGAGEKAGSSYIESFSASARRKAEAVLGFLADGTFPAGKPVFVSVGGGDGEELAHLLDNSKATHGVLLELSDEFADKARDRKLGDGKTIRVFQGSAQSRIAEAMDHAARLVKEGRGDSIIVTCHAVIHELYDRGDANFDDLAFFGPIFKYSDIPTGFTYREPGDIDGWPDELLISASCDPDSLLKLANEIRQRHEALRKLTPAPQTIAGESLRVHRTLGLELLAKLFYLDDLPHEIEERSTSINHARLNDAIQTAIGDTARTQNRTISQTHSGPTGSFVEHWKRWNVRIDGRDQGQPKHFLPVPEFQKRMIVWRAAQEHAATAPSTAAATQDTSPDSSPVTATADFDPKKRVFHVPYAPKGDRVVGRQDALKRVRDQLTTGRRTAIGQTAAFDGLGGLGKTQLAVEYAWEYADQYPNGVIWIEADQDIHAQLTALAVKARWVADASEHRYKLDVALKRLRSFGDCLIIFDNVEHRAAIEPYLPEPAVIPHILITSRTPQNGFEKVDLDPLNDHQSRQLLIQEAGRSPTSEEDARAVDEIAKRLDGLPLAIEIAGAYLHEMPATTFAEFWLLLDRDPEIQAGREHLSSFTRHEADLDAALRVSARVLERHPRLEAVLDLLTWSGAAPMSTSLMSTLLDVTPIDLLEPLALGARLHLLKEERDSPGSPELQRRFRIHRLVRDVRRVRSPLATRVEFVERIAKRLAGWFRERREDFAHLASFESEIDHLRAWQENTRRHAPAHTPELLWLEAYPAWHRGDYALSKRLLDGATEALKHTQGNTILHAHLLNDLGTVYGLLGHPLQGLEHAEKALSIRRELHGDSHPDTIQSYSNVNAALHALGNHQRALQRAEKALSLCRTALGEKHPETVRAFSNVGDAHFELGNYPVALSFFETALSLRRELWGEAHPDTASAYANVGSAHVKLGNHALGLTYLEKSLSLLRELLGDRHPDVAGAYQKLGGAHFAGGNTQRALQYGEQALSLCRESLGEQHPRTARVCSNVAATYAKMNDHRRALPYRERAMQIFNDSLGLNHPASVEAQLNAARTYSEVGLARDGFRIVRSILQRLTNDRPDLREARQASKWFIDRYPYLRQLASGHQPKKLRNQKRR